MLGSDRQILHARILGKLGPLIGVEFDWIEFFSQQFIFFDRDLGPIHDPFAESRYRFVLPRSGRDRIQTPMNEQPEFGFTKPLTAWVV